MLVVAAPPIPCTPMGSVATSRRILYYSTFDPSVKKFSRKTRVEGLMTIHGLSPVPPICCDGEARTHGRVNTWYIRETRRLCHTPARSTEAVVAYPTAKQKTSGESNAHLLLTAVDFATYHSLWLKHIVAHQWLMRYGWPRVGIRVIFIRIVHSDLRLYVVLDSW